MEAASLSPTPPSPDRILAIGLAVIAILGVAELLGVAVLVDGLALDELHHVVRQAVVGRAAIEQARDVGMIEAGQDLPLVPESPQDEIGIHAPLDDLDGDLLPEMIVSANSPVHRPHAPAADLFDDAVGPNAPSDGGIGNRPGQFDNTPMERWLLDEKI